MNENEQLINFNLADPDSVAERIPEIEDVVAQKKRTATEATRDFEYWENLLGHLRWVAGLVLDIREGDEPTEAGVEAVTAIVDREQRPIMSIGVAEALEYEGHHVESPDAVAPILEAAAAAGLVQEFAPGSYAPKDLPRDELPDDYQPVPEAHLGLGGPRPRSKAEGALRVLGTAPGRAWSPAEVAQVMAEAGWVVETPKELASITSTLSRLHGERKIFRPHRGRYQLAPPMEVIDGPRG